LPAPDGSRAVVEGHREPVVIGVVLGTGWTTCGRPGVEYIRRKHHTYNVPSEAPHLLVEGVSKLARYGCTTVILTNAAGGLNPTIRVGEVVCISDHINLSGYSPTTEFHEMDSIYTVVDSLRGGVYAQVPGPAFETPAEARYLRTIGADMVGMSTALEAGYAHSLGLRVVGLSCIANRAGTAAGHADVLNVTSQAGLPQILAEVVDTLIP
jgi:purine-nucleoside phosphorylase